MDFSKYYERVVFLEPGYNDIVKRSEEFYELTKKRDEYFIEKSLEKMDLEKESKAVLVTGGYHTTNLKNILKAKGISYIVVTPQILHETNLKNYEKVLLKQDLNPTIFGKLTTPALSTMAILHTAASPLAMQAVGARLTSLRETQSERGNLTTSSPKSLIGDRMDSRLSANKASADPSSGGRGNDLGVHTLAAARLADVYFEWTPQYTARLIAYLEEGISQLRDLELLAQSDQTRDVLTKNIAKLENQKERILGADPTTVPQFLNAISDIGDELYRYLRNFNYTTPESNKSIYTLFNHGLIFGTDSWEKAKDVLLTYDYLLNMKIIGAQYSRQGILVKLYLNCLDDNFNLVTKSNFFGPNDTVQYSIIDAEENNVIGSVTLDLDKSLHTARIKKININSDYPKLDPQILSDWFRAFWKLSLGKSLTVENENFAVTFGARMALEGESSTSSPFHLSNQPTQLQAARLAAQKPTLASNLVTRVFNEGIEILTASLIVTKSALTSVISLFRTFTSSLREVRSSAMAEISFLKDSTSAATSLLVYPLLGSLGVVINQNSSTADGFNQVGTENPLAGSRMPEATFSAISPQPSSQPGALVVGARAAADEKLAWVIAAIQMGESSEVLKVFRDESQPLVVRLEAASHLVKLANRDFAAQANRLLYEAFDDTTNSVEARTIAAVAIQEQLNPPDRHASWRYPETVVANESFPLEARMTAAIYVLRHHNPPDRTKAWGLPGRVLKDETAPFSARLRAAVYIYKTSNPPDRPLPVYARQLIAKTYHFGARIGLLRRVLDGTASQDPGARLAESKPQITDDSLQSPVSSLQSSQGARLSRRTLVRSFWDILTDVVKLQKEKQIDPKSFTIEELEQKGLWWSDYDRKSFHVGRMLEVGIEGKWIIWSESKQSYSLSDETFRKIVLEIEAEKKRSEQHRENVDRLMLAIASNLNPTAFTLPELQALGLPIEDISSLIDSLKLNERWIISTGKQTVWPGRGNFKYAIYTLTEKGHAKLRELGARLADLQTGIERIEGERRIISGPLYSISDVMLAVSNHIGSYANPRIFKAFAVPANDEELNDSSQLPWFYLPEFARDRTNLRQYLDSRHQNNPEPLPSYRLEEAHFRHQGLSGKIIFIVPYIDGNVPAEYPVVPRSLAAEAKRPDDKALVESGRPGARMAKTTMQSPTVDRESLTFRRKRKNGIVINDNVSIWVENIDAKGIDISLSTSEKNVRLMSLSDYRRLQANDFRGVRSISRNRWQNLRMPRNDSFVIFLSRKINAQTPYSVISITKLNNDDVWLTIEKPSFIPVHRYEIYGELEEQQRQERLRQLPSLSGTSAVRREQTVVLRKSGLPIHLTERDTLSMAQRAGAVVFELREMADPRFKIYPIPPRGRVLTLPIHDRTERIKIQIVSISKDKSYAVIRFKAVGARLAVDYSAIPTEELKELRELYNNFIGEVSKLPSEKQSLEQSLQIDYYNRAILEIDEELARRADTDPDKQLSTTAAARLASGGSEIENQAKALLKLVAHAKYKQEASKTLVGMQVAVPLGLNHLLYELLDQISDDEYAEAYLTLKKAKQQFILDSDQTDEKTSRISSSFDILLQALIRAARNTRWDEETKIKLNKAISDLLKISGITIDKLTNNEIKIFITSKPDDKKTFRFVIQLSSESQPLQTADISEGRSAYLLIQILTQFEGLTKRNYGPDIVEIYKRLHPEETPQEIVSQITEQPLSENQIFQPDKIININGIPVAKITSVSGAIDGEGQKIPGAKSVSLLLLGDTIWSLHEIAENAGFLGSYILRSAKWAYSDGYRQATGIPSKGELLAGKDLSQPLRRRDGEKIISLQGEIITLKLVPLVQPQKTGARMAEFKLNARHMDVLKRFYDYEASGSTSGLAIEEVEPGRDRNLIILKLEKNGYLEKLPLEQYVLTTKGYKVVEDNLQNYGDNNLYRRLDGVYKPSTIYRQSPQKYQERLPRRIERVGDPRTRRNLGGYGARLADLALGVVKAHAADELENPFALTRVNAPERVRAVKTVNGARLISIAPDGTQSLLVEASSNRNRPINPTDSPTAHDIVTRFRQVHLNTDLEMPAHMEARTALAHVFNLEPFAAFTDEDFMEQILNLQAEVLKTQTTRTYKNDVFYLDGSENLSERQRGLLETIKTPFILGKPDAFEGVIVRYVVTDNLNAVPSQDGRSIFMPVQGISAGHGEGWYQVISEAGLVGGFFARHLNADGKINFTEINVNELPSEAFHFHNSVTAMKNLEQYYQLLVGGLSLALMKKLAFKLPIIEASGARLIQAGMMMLRAVGVAA